ncbi:hypothetical protein HC256_005295 [Beauveria bassiana]|nr:hypothetical protein HC256_005295 [Beauveria bassiana]
MKSESTRPTAIIVSFHRRFNNDACTVGPPRCQRMKAMDEMYCPEHATCGVPGCFATPDRLSNKTLPWYCNAHTQAVRLPVIVEGYVLYMLHSHGEDARDEAPSYPPEEPPSNVHQCDGDCTEHRHSNKVVRPDSFCRLPGCNRLRQTKEGGESEWCEKHTCESYLCLRKRSDRQPSMTTCERHSCGVERCDQAAQGRSTFCRRHGCEADNCGQYKETHSWYCNQHECQRARCLNKAVPGTDHCPRHLEEEQAKRLAAESRKREEERKVTEEKKKKKESEGYRREPRHCYQTAVVTPLVIVDEDGVRSDPQDRFADIIMAALWAGSLYAILMIWTTCALIDRWRGPSDKIRTGPGSVFAAFVLSTAWPVVMVYILLNS